MAQNPITLEALTVIATIEQRGSYAAAAEQLNKVPSALSYIIQKLEEQLGVTLFQKQGRRSVLTPAGKHLLVEGQHILQAVSQLAVSTQTIANGWEPKLRIAIDSVIPHNIVFPVFNEFLTLHPSVEIDVCEEVMNGGWEALIEDNVDLLIGAPEPIPVQKGILATPLSFFDPVFCVNPEHHLAQCKQPLSDQDIGKYRTVVVHDSAQTYIPWTAGIIPQSHFFYVQTVEFKIQAQLAGIGCGFLPRSRIKQYLENGQLIELTLEANSAIKPTYLASKVVNQGKALKTLRKMIKNSLS